MEIIQVQGLNNVADIFVARMRGADGFLLEFVDGLADGLPRRQKWIINISTQFGCPVQCLFCDAGGDFKGNCTADEMIAQIQELAGRHPDLIHDCNKLKVHFSRMGEPALNDAVLEVIERLPQVLPARNLWCCLATVAPAGRRTWFKGLAEILRARFPGRFQLQFSINSTDESERRRLMPRALEDLSWVAAQGREYFQPGDRKLGLNFALVHGAAFEPQEIIRWFDPSIFMLKLTPLNPTSFSAKNNLETVLRSHRAQSLENKVESLRRAGFEVILSVGEPLENIIGSNCGQAVQQERGSKGSARRS